MNEKPRLHYSNPMTGSGNIIFLKINVLFPHNNWDCKLIVGPSGPCPTKLGRKDESNLNINRTHNIILRQSTKILVGSRYQVRIYDQVQVQEVNFQQSRNPIRTLL